MPAIRSGPRDLLCDTSSLSDERSINPSPVFSSGSCSSPEFSFSSSLGTLPPSRKRYVDIDSESTDSDQEESETSQREAYSNQLAPQGQEPEREPEQALIEKSRKGDRGGKNDADKKVEKNLKEKFRRKDNTDMMKEMETLLIEHGKATHLKKLSQANAKSSGLMYDKKSIMETFVAVWDEYGQENKQLQHQNEQLRLEIEILRQARGRLDEQARLCEQTSRPLLEDCRRLQIGIEKRLVPLP
jgi:hypothetical protein